MNSFYEAYDEEGTGGSGPTGDYTTRGLQLDFDFKNKSGIVVLDSANGKAGNLGGGSLSFDNNGLTFGGSSYSTVTVGGTTTGVYQPTTEFTLEAYIKPTASTSYGNLIGRASIYQFVIALNSRAPSFTMFNGSSSISCAGSNITLNSWVHIVATYSKSNGMRLYVNGTLVSTKTLSVDVPTVAQDGNTYDFTIGGQDVVSHYFKGTIAVARYYNVELNSEEITNNYKSI